MPRVTKAQLEERVKALEEQIEYSEKVNTQVNLLKAGGEPDGTFCLELQSKVWPLIAHSLMVWFEHVGAKNYVEQQVDYPTEEEKQKTKSSMDFTTVRGMFILTLQKKFMKTPNELRMEAETEVKNLRATMQKIMQVLGPEAVCACAGCAWETGEAIRLLKERGIEYQEWKRLGPAHEPEVEALGNQIVNKE